MDRILLFLALVFPNIFHAQYTYHEDIAPILRTHCTSCHSDGQIGPMSLNKYEDVASYASMIKFVTETKLMPPFKADHHKVEYANERSISREEIAIISEWIETGLAEGKESIPILSKNEVQTEYDFTLCMESSFEHYGIYYDQYQAFVLPIEIDEDKYVKEIVFEPGNKEIVRAANISIAKKGKADIMDAWDPRYGFFAYGSIGFEAELPIWHTWMPNTESLHLLDHETKYLPSNSDLILHLHYGPFGEIQTDSSCIHLNFEDETSVKSELQNVPLVSPTFIQDTFLLLAGEKSRFRSEFILPEDSQIKSITPLSHLLCTSWEVFAVRPDGHSIPLLSIDDWDFHWREKFIFQQAKHLPKGTRIISTATYDNTNNNPYNPSDPPHNMKQGPHMFDENFVCYFEFISKTSQAHLFKPFSVSTGAFRQISMDIKSPGEYEIHIYDLDDGRLIHSLNRKLAIGKHAIQSGSFPQAKGRYLMSIRQNDKVLDQWFYCLK